MGQERSRLDEHLARLGLGDRFDAIVTARDVALGKPAPDIYLETARRLGVALQDCLVLEDSVPGCLAAVAAGMTAVACPSRVSLHCDYPAGVSRVSSLLDVLEHQQWGSAF